MPIAINRPAAEVLSTFITGTLEKRLAKKALSSWPSSTLNHFFEEAREQLRKFDDVKGWPIDNPNRTRESAFLRGATRTAAELDLKLITTAIHVRADGAESKEAPPAAAEKPKERAETAIAPEVPEGIAADGRRYVRTELLEPDPLQPRTDADDAMKESVRIRGVLKTLWVFEHPDPAKRAKGIFLIHDGECRWRAALASKRKTVPVEVKPAALLKDRVELVVQQHIANQGRPIKPIDQARSWRELQSLTGWGVIQLARELDLPKSTVSDRLAILNAPAAFLPLFEQERLTAAAAPIIRRLAGVPIKFLEAGIAYLRKQPGFKAAEKAGEPLEVGELENEIRHAIQSQIPREHSFPYDVNASDFKGATFGLFDRVQYATDPAALKAFVAAAEKRQAERRAAEQKSSRNRSPDKYQLKQRAEERARRRQQDLRRLQFRALAPKLPASIGANAKWPLFIVRRVAHLLSTDTARLLCATLNLELKKASYGGKDYRGTLVKHADGLSAAELVQFLVQLTIAGDLYVSNYGGRTAKDLPEAAKLAGVNLAKVKLVDDTVPAAGQLTAKTIVFPPKPPIKPEKGGKDGKKKRRSPNAMFMKPHQASLQLAAIVGDKPQPRTDVTKKLWAYIKKHALQDKQDKKERRMINADAALQLVFAGKTRVNMFEMTKHVQKHTRAVGS